MSTPRVPRHSRGGCPLLFSAGAPLPADLITAAVSCPPRSPAAPGWTAEPPSMQAAVWPPMVSLPASGLCRLVCGRGSRAAGAACAVDWAASALTTALAFASGALSGLPPTATAEPGRNRAQRMPPRRQKNTTYLPQADFLGERDDCPRWRKGPQAALRKTASASSTCPISMASVKPVGKQASSYGSGRLLRFSMRSCSIAPLLRVIPPAAIRRHILRIAVMLLENGLLSIVYIE